MPILVTAEDIASAILRIDGAAKGVAGIFANCPSLDAGTRAAWDAWYADWQQWAAANQGLGFLTLGLPAIGNQAVGYESDVATWQSVANRVCGSQVPILASQTDIANANAAVPSTWMKAIPWIAGAAALIFVAPPLIGWARDATTKTTKKKGALANPMDPNEITDRQIRALQREAAEAGDLAQVEICRMACGDYEEATQGQIAKARRECARAMTFDS